LKPGLESQEGSRSLGLGFFSRIYGTNIRNLQAVFLTASTFSAAIISCNYWPEIHLQTYYAILVLLLQPCLYVYRNSVNFCAVKLKKNSVNFLNANLISQNPTITPSIAPSPFLLNFSMQKGGSIIAGFYGKYES
jgi:hypothetical protein